MDNLFTIDSTTHDSYSEIRDYLFIKLKPILKSNRNIIFICIGTDRTTGDSLGPLIGYKLRFLKNNNIHIYGSLENPIHSNNLLDILAKIKSTYNDPYIIAVDASLSSFQNVGKIFIENKPLLPSLALGKNLPPIGDMTITGIVNISGNSEFMILQNTRLCTVMSLADSIANGIYHFVLKSLGNKNSKSMDFFPTNSLIK